MLIRKYGCKRDTVDSRDLYLVRTLSDIQLPASVDLRPSMPEVYDQKSIGSCTSQAISAAHHFNQIKQGAVMPFVPSRLFLYFNERVMEGTVMEDAGAMIRDGVKSLVQQGICPESMWAYADENVFMMPPQPCYVEALNHQALTYMRVPQTMHDICACLASGYPVVFGFSVYANFETAAVSKTGMMTMPDGDLRGGHAVMIVGYDNTMQRFIVRNSWGEGWGDKGYFYMPYRYATDSDLAHDFWTIRTVEV